MTCFLQKISLCHTQLYMGPKHHAKFQKKTNEPIPRKLKDRQKDGQMDRRTLFYRTLPAKVGGPKKEMNLVII